MERPRLAVLALACAAAWAGPAFAQSSPGAEPGVSVDECQVEPMDETESQSEAPAPDENLTAKLDKCNGVLQPPPTGDADIKEEPPASGKTPVIPPGALPEEQPPSEG